VVERSVAEYSLDEPIGAPHGIEATVDKLVADRRVADMLAVVRLSDTAYPDSLPDSGKLQPEDIQGICANPLADEPHPAIVSAVKRFGVVGLVACALGTGLMRWWKSLAR
jgi:hypothetical protein